MNGFRLSVVAGLVVLTGVACAGDGTGLEEFMPGGDQVTLSGDVQPIFTSNCALSGCHAGTNPQQGMNLSAGQTFANVVNVQAMELSTMNRVTPDEPDNSYLVHKVQGTHLNVGGSGNQMPLGRSPLTQTDIDLIRAWIEAGALPD
ncbi:MAG: hypothetical protein V3T56_05180 [Gemmatimonadales bacterium]